DDFGNHWFTIPPKLKPVVCGALFSNGVDFLCTIWEKWGPLLSAESNDILTRYNRDIEIISWLWKVCDKVIAGQDNFNERTWSIGLRFTQPQNVIEPFERRGINRRTLLVSKKIKEVQFDRKVEQWFQGFPETEGMVGDE
ncbi:MAG: hypothetical protein WCQ66_08975, partial [Sphaerochaetaceae bacterium]